MKRLNIVVGETPKGALKVLYLGRAPGEAAEAVEKAVAEGKLAEVVHVRDPKVRKRRKPVRMAAARAEATGKPAPEEAKEPE